MKAGAIELEMVPQGTLIERVRAGGAGLAGFYTPTGVGTAVAEGKEERVFDGKRYIFERAIRADFALLQALPGRRRRQPHLPPRHAQLRPGVRDRGEDDDRRGEGDRRRSARSIPRRW